MCTLIETYANVTDPLFMNFDCGNNYKDMNDLICIAETIFNSCNNRFTFAVRSKEMNIAGSPLTILQRLLAQLSSMSLKFSMPSDLLCRVHWLQACFEESFGNPLHALDFLLRCKHILSLSGESSLSTK